MEAAQNEINHLKTFKRKFDNLYSESNTDKEIVSQKKEDDLVVVKVVPSSLPSPSKINSAKNMCFEPTVSSTVQNIIMNALQNCDNSQKTVNLSPIDLWVVKNKPPPSLAIQTPPK